MKFWYSDNSELLNWEEEQQNCLKQKMYRKSVKRFKKRKFCNREWFLISFWIVSIIKLGSNIQGKPTSYFFSVLMNYSWTKTLVQEQFAWNLSSCLTKIWISPTLQVGWSGLPKHQLMLDFIFPPNLSELPFLVIPMKWATKSHLFN